MHALESLLQRLSLAVWWLCRELVMGNRLDEAYGTLKMPVSGVSMKDVTSGCEGLSIWIHRKVSRVFSLFPVISLSELFRHICHFGILGWEWSGPCPAWPGVQVLIHYDFTLWEQNGLGSLSGTKLCILWDLMWVKVKFVLLSSSMYFQIFLLQQHGGTSLLDSQTHTKLFLFMVSCQNHCSWGRS